jgi:hypothetical protein
MNEKQIEAVLALAGPERVKHFAKVSPTGKRLGPL